MGRRNYQGGTFTVSPDGPRLKALRGSYPKQPRQYEVEKLSGVSRGQLTRYETGKPASAQDLKKLAEFYGVEPAELLSPEGLEMCNQILDEMCLFTNKKVVANTNGNRQIVDATSPERWDEDPRTSPNTPEDDLETSHQTPELALSGMTEEETEEIVLAHESNKVEKEL